MTIIDDELEARLAALADELVFDDARLVEVVLERIASTPESTSDRATRWLRVAAAAVLVVAAAAMAIPSSRRAVADWLGFDGVRIERVPDLSVPVTASPIEQDASGAVDHTVIEVDGVELLVSEIPGEFEAPLLSKTLGDGTGVIQVDVGGQPGVWIDGAPHEVGYRAAAGSYVFDRFAGNTLLWQDGDVIRRVEGFDRMTAAIAFAENFGT